MQIDLLTFDHKVCFTPIFPLTIAKYQIYSYTYYNELITLCILPGAPGIK